MILLIVATCFASLLVFVMIHHTYDIDQIHTYLDKSVPYIGIDTPRENNIDGKGIKVAVIDTGVDYNHPDLFGWGPDGKIIGGYNFIQEGSPPLDTNGHGTQVAGVIASDGQLVGVAPKAKILAYKVSEDGEGVSAELITRAIERAIEDGADIINISLGVNKTNLKIDRAVSRALEQDILVVVAAGNDGPDVATIGSPGRSNGAITVGATYNNLTSSIVATLDVDGKPYTAIPMVGSSIPEQSIKGEIVFGGFGRESEIREIDADDKIVIVQRGSDIEGELLYFSIKERNAAQAGAKALIVYNNEEGIFLGELVHEFIESGYEPTIPVVSLDGQEGQEIIMSLNGTNHAIMNLFYNPDHITHFSSRGPVSPFYIKPEIVAPGTYINTTQNDSGYNFTSGTSYAAPHVSGAAALILQKNPNLTHTALRSILLTTTHPVSDIYGQQFSVYDVGSGRLDIKRAFDANLVITPPNFVSIVTTDKPSTEQHLDINTLRGDPNIVKVEFVGPDLVRFEHTIKSDGIDITLRVADQTYGKYEGRILIHDDTTRYTVPFVLHYTAGSIVPRQVQDTIQFDITHPETWSFAKITVINRDDSTKTVTATPDRLGSIAVHENVEHWIKAQITTPNGTSDAYSIINIDDIDDSARVTLIDISTRPIAIIISAVAIIGVFGFIVKIRHRNIPHIKNTSDMSL